jgi:hypothetical protein
MRFSVFHRIIAAALLLAASAAVHAQSVTFFGINDALANRCFNSAAARADPTNPNRLLIAIHPGSTSPYIQSAACYASDSGPRSTMDTISFVVAAPVGYKISRIGYSYTGSTSGSRGGSGYIGSTWVVDDRAAAVFGGTTNWATLSGASTIVPVSITTTLVGFGGNVSSGSASLTNPIVTVELVPLTP